ncbi:putative protein S-acyltransferase [Helianthus annuus]|nr:putative protein S-acyltransferase [Helianthus annuus]KAJ0649811.1 putative protein S-acyltransferase [Helianthus annuus]
MLLVVATLVQYYFTSGSSPGYVIDAMSDFAETEASLRTSEFSNAVVTVDGNQSGQNLLGNNLTNWTTLVMDMYPPGTSVRDYTCPYCNVVQPPRAKHCHDCKKCVLQFDHHCVWLGTCIGQGNHCRFWCYILEQTAVCIWSGFLYVENLPAHSERAMWVDVIMIIVISILLVALMFLLLLLIFHRYVFVLKISL